MKVEVQSETVASTAGNVLAEGAGTYRKYDLEDRLIEFAAEVTEVVETLPANRTGSHIAGQLVRCCTSPMLNYGEAQAAESRADFIHKMKVSLKELRETRTCLKFIRRKKLFNQAEKLERDLRENEELIQIFVKSIATARQNLRNEGK
jgi:four helix bundle protein